MNEAQWMHLLATDLPFLKDRLISPQPKRIYTDWLTAAELLEVARAAKEELGLTRGMHVIGTDEGQDLGLSYLLTGEDGVILILREKTPKADPRVPSLTPLYPSMLLHERELEDLYGAVVEGLPPGRNYPLPDAWPAGNYPMRKEWKPEYLNKDTMRYEPPTGAEEGQYAE